MAARRTSTLLRLGGRSALVGLTTAGVLFVLAAVLPGFDITGIWDGVAPAVLAAVAISLVNAVVWPLVLRVVLGLVVLSFGLGAFVLNALLVWGALELVPGVRVSSLPVAALVTVVASAASAAAAGTLPLGRDAADLRALRQAERRSRSGLPVRPLALSRGRLHVSQVGAQRSAARIEAAGRTVPAPLLPSRIPGPEVPGMVLVQVDGLSTAALRRAVAAGRVPYLERELRTRRLVVHRWDTGVASQTAASQCGLLFGDASDVPAFRWLEKESGRVVVANRPEGAALMEGRLSDGRGLLHADGAVSATLVSGDAGYAILTMSVAGQRKGRLGTGYGGYFTDPARAIRTAWSFPAEIGREVLASLRARWAGHGPLIHRGGYYPLLRALTTIVARDVAVQSVLDHVLAGRSVVYADLLGYDEVAHHSGLTAPDTMAVLQDLDARIARIAATAALVRRPYRLVLLSDHGQTPTRPFRDVFGVTLVDTVRLACGLPLADRSARRRLERRPGAGLEASWSVSAALAEVPAAALRGRAGSRLLDADARRASGGESDPEEQVVTLASGGLGLVSFPRVPGRLTHDQVVELFPGLLPALRAHPGIGFVVVATAATPAPEAGDDTGDRTGAGAGSPAGAGAAPDPWPVVLGASGLRRLGPPAAPGTPPDGGRGSDVVEGVDPLGPWGGDAAAWSLRRAARFRHAPDVLVQAAFDPGVPGGQFSFEDFAASHGALGGEQNDAFVLAPPDLAGPGGPLRGGESVHRLLRGWLGRLGHPAFALDVPAAEPAQPAPAPAGAVPAPAGAVPAPDGPHRPRVRVPPGGDDRDLDRDLHRGR